MKSRIMKFVYVALLYIVCLIVIIFFISRFQSIYQKKTPVISPNDRYISESIDETTRGRLKKVEELISAKMNEAKIPGLSIAIISEGKTLYKSGFGNADIASCKKVTTGTLFQIGSNSKAFTGLGVLQLKKDGLIRLTDPITKYIPWLKLYYESDEAEVTVNDFLHHTSGISSISIVNIPSLDENCENAIEKTVRMITGMQLSRKPGTKHEYATINYDVLGLLIEKISGLKYEEYIQKYVLDPAGLNGTYMYRSSAEENNMASGYKIGFFLPRYYNAPRYEGNKPAGYIISNADDMALWLQIQMDAGTNSAIDQALIAESQSPDKNISGPVEGVYYAAGWYVYDEDITEIFHGGRNPNFSSQIVFRPKEKTGVAVLSNTKSDYVTDIAQSVLEVLNDEQGRNIMIEDINQIFDKLCVMAAAALFLLACVLLYPLIRLIYRIVTRKQDIYLGKKQLIKCLALLFVFLSICTMFFYSPYLFLGKQTWSYWFIWYPMTVKVFVYAFYTSLVLIYLNISLKMIKRNSKEVSTYKYYEGFK